MWTKVQVFLFSTNCIRLSGKLRQRSEFYLLIGAFLAIIAEARFCHDDLPRLIIRIVSLKQFPQRSGLDYVILTSLLHKMLANMFLIGCVGQPFELRELLLWRTQAQ